MTQLLVRGDYIAGEFRPPLEVNGEWTLTSPADLSDELARIVYSYESVDRAVSAAREALPAWRGLAPGDRAGLIQRYEEVLGRRTDELVGIMAREVGKPLWEGRQEVEAMRQQIQVALREGPRFIVGFDQQEAGLTGQCRYRPLGIFAVIGSCASPGLLPSGHLVAALLAGNAVVFKPSERAPLTGQFLAECFHEAALPRGVVNLVQGEKELGRRLVVHEGVDGILFSGSYEVGTRIKQDTLQQHWKLLVLEMGGKNSAIVCEDADLQYAVHETVVGAFLSAGQRCTATSRVIVHESLVDRFVDTLHERAKAFTIGHPLKDPFMGPMIDPSSVDRYMKFVGIASREGCDVVMRGKMLELEHRGNYVTPSICRVKDGSVQTARKSTYQQTELAAPNVAVLSYRELDQAIALADVMQYGLSTAVFTAAQATFERCRDTLRCGLVNWNLSTVRVSPQLPFLGYKKSGNFRPTGVLSLANCAMPVSSLQKGEVGVWRPEHDGLNWDLKP